MYLLNAVGLLRRHLIFPVPCHRTFLLLTFVSLVSAGLQVLPRLEMVTFVTCRCFYFHCDLNVLAVTRVLGDLCWRWCVHVQVGNETALSFIAREASLAPLEVCLLEGKRLLERYRQE